MKHALVLLSLLSICVARAWGSTPVLVQDFEKDSSAPKVWVVGIPNDNASVKLSTDHPHDGKQCAQLHYHFTGSGQYLGVANTVKIIAPIHKLHYWIYGDGSGCGCAVYVSDATGEVHKYKDPAAIKIDFKGWKEIVMDLDGSHETWGGDKNGKIDYPITGITFEIGYDGKTTVDSSLYFDDISVDSEKSADETLAREVSVVSPAYCSDIKGDTRITVAAAGFKNVTAKCWKQGDGFGADSTVSVVPLDAEGNGSFIFPADQYPHGPITIRISGDNRASKDNCYLQLYNKGGASWNEGAPKDPPAPAKGMELLFADDFSGPLSISTADPKATYFDHKPLGGDFSTIPFTGHDDRNNPFSQVDTYLRIRADAKKKSSGLISSLHNDGHGIKASTPCYFECRFLAPNAIGTWPAFWLMTDYPTERKNGKPENQVLVDELDIIEAYGGEGPHEPNSYDLYQVTPHAWNQGNAGKAAEARAQKELHNPTSMKKAGIPSTWFETFHIYGCLVTDTDTIYYCDNIEVGRHKTLDVSKKQPLFFMINLATGGGWPVDLSRYDGVADMYVDYVRVYQGKK
jgi:Glycosyl hydrolases family 16